MKFIKNIFGGTYDSDTGKISGVKKGTWGWYHEEAHKRQDESGKLSKTWMWLRFIMYIIIAQILWELNLDVLVYLMIAPEVYLELDAWYYAYKKKTKGL